MRCINECDYTRVMSEPILRRVQVSQIILDREIVFSFQIRSVKNSDYNTVYNCLFLAHTRSILFAEGRVN